MENYKNINNSFLKEFRSPYGDEGGITSHSQECMYEEEDAEIEKSPETEHLKRIREIILNAELNSGTEEEYAEFNKRKEEVDRLLSEIIKKTGDYKRTVIYLDKEHRLTNANKSNTKEDVAEYQEKNKRLEKSRTLSHDVLLDAIKMTIRYINYNFGDIDSSLIDKWEEEQEERGNIILDVKRIKFPKNIICPDDVDLDNRKSLGAWAIKLTDTLK